MTRELDVVDLLLDQHEQIRRMFTEVEAATGEERRRVFHELVRLLAVHESAEEMIVHPAVRAADGARTEAVVDARLEEEKAAKATLAELYDMGTDDPRFPARFTAFAATVLEHAEMEEAEEFPLLLREISPERLQRMARTVKAAESVAPTRPHPGAGESATANVLMGTPIAVFDRVRDALRDRLGKDG